MKTGFALLPTLGLLLAWSAPWACQTYTLADGGMSNINPDIDGGSGERGDVTQGVDAGSGGPVCTGIVLTPSNPTLPVAYPTPGTLAMTAECQLSGGGTVPVTATWFTTHPDLVSVDSASGLVTADGPRGGPAVVTAGYQGFVASTTVTVIVTQTVYAGAAGTAATCFAGAPGGGGPALIYPNDQAIVPVNIQPLDFQWQPGSGNLYQVTLSGAYANLIAYVEAPFNAPPFNDGEPSWQPDPAVWSAFVHSSEGVTIQMQVAATSAASCGVGAIKAGPARALTLADSRMAGTIYYWAVNLGQILQIPAGTDTALPVYTPPGADCIACHSVSPDGTKLSAELWGGGNPGTVIDLTSSPATPIVDVGPAWDFSTFDSSSSLLVVSHNGGLTLRDANTAAPVPAASGEGNLGSSLGCAVGATCTQPVWSRDGDYLAYIRGTASFGADWSFDNGSRLEISQWLSGPQTFAAPSVLVPDDGSGWEAVYPTISVDDSLVAYTRSPCSYGSNCTYSAQLDLVPMTGGAPIELSAAEGGDTSNRFPNFSPYKEGGYHWMAFFSLRDYGWVTTNQRQIWIAAVDDNAAPTSDTSHPAFWLAGQNTDSENDKAEWATLPCAGHGQACQGNVDCCTPLVCSNSTSVCLTPTEACTTSWTYSQTFSGPGTDPEFDEWQDVAFTYSPDPLDPADDIAVAVRVASTAAGLATAADVPVCDLNVAPGCATPQSLANLNLAGRYIAVDFTFTHASCTSIPDGAFPEITSVNVTSLDSGN